MEARRCGMLPVLCVSQGEQLVLCIATDVSTVLLPLRTDICQPCCVLRLLLEAFPFLWVVYSLVGAVFSQPPRLNYRAVRVEFGAE
jgi:hypothetical protein